MSPAAPPLRVLIYSRVSRDESARHGWSLAGHAEDCRKYAQAHGYQVIDVILESGQGDDWNLPGLAEAIQRARARQFDALLCWDTDRLGRTVAKQAALRRLFEQCGVQLLFVRTTIQDSPEGRLLFNMKAAIDEYEREKTLARALLGRAMKLKAGLPLGNGTPPYGYRAVLAPQSGKVVGYEPIPELVPVIQRIFRLVCQRSYDQVAAILDREGVDPPAVYRKDCRPTHWHPNAVRKIVQNPLYRGEYVFGKTSSRRREGRIEVRRRAPEDWLRIPLPSARIVDDALWERANAAAAERRRWSVSRVRDPDLYTLRRRIDCGRCGQTMQTHTSGSGERWARVYVCARRWQGECDLPASLPARGFERWAWEQLLRVLLDRANLERFLTERAQHFDRHPVVEQLRMVQAEEQEAAARLARASRELVRYEPDSPAAESLRAVLQTADEQVRRLRRARERLEQAVERLRGAADERILIELAERIRQVQEQPDPEIQRRVYELLGIRFKVAPAPPGQGWRFGKLRIWWRVEWTALVPLPPLPPQPPNNSPRDLVLRNGHVAAHIDGWSSVLAWLTIRIQHSKLEVLRVPL